MVNSRDDAIGTRRLVYIDPIGGPSLCQLSFEATAETLRKSRYALLRSKVVPEMTVKALLSTPEASKGS